MSIRSLAALLLLLLTIPRFAPAQSGPYLAGGLEPFDPRHKAILDSHSDILSLGINHDWLKASQIDQEAYIQAIDVVARAVEQRHIPGAVLLADRFISNTMPAAIGYMVVDPQRRPLTTETQFYVEDLTGPLLTVPLILQAIRDGRLEPGTTVGSLIPALADGDKAAITVAMLLRHCSGLPAEIPRPARFRSDEEMLRALDAIPLSSPPGTRIEHSPLNFLMLGLMLEGALGAPLGDLAREVSYLQFGQGRTTMEVEAHSRATIAPGEYDPWLGRMVWAEAREPFGLWLGPRAGHTGMVTSADDLLFRGKDMLTAAVMASLGADDAATTFPLALGLRPDPTLPGGESMGLGYQLGKYGPGSFGWDSPGGSSLWILPDRFGIVIYLSSGRHPDGKPAPGVDPRERALGLLVESLKSPMPVTGAVDTPAPMPDPAGRIQPPPKDPPDGVD